MPQEFLQGGGRGVPVGDSHHSVGGDDACLHDVHVLPADGVIQAEHLPVGGRDLHLGQLCHGPSPLVGDVVDHQQAASVCHLSVVSIVSLYGSPICLVTRILLQQ